MRREFPKAERLVTRISQLAARFRPVKQLKARVATKVVTYFAIAVLAIGVVAGLVAALLGG